jgi:hypothetical protein
LNPYKGLVRSRVAAIATAGKLVEGGAEFSAALCSNRFFKLLDPWIDDGLDHLGDRNAVKVWMQPCGVLQAFLDLINLVSTLLLPCAY